LRASERARNLRDVCGCFGEQEACDGPCQDGPARARRKRSKEEWRRSSSSRYRLWPAGVCCGRLESDSAPHCESFDVVRVPEPVLSAEGDESGRGDKVLEGGVVVADGDEAVVFGLEVVPGLSCRLPASVECLCACVSVSAGATVRVGRVSSSSSSTTGPDERDGCTCMVLAAFALARSCSRWRRWCLACWTRSRWPPVWLWLDPPRLICLRARACPRKRLSIAGVR
jgi:hypothetical protein